MTDGWIDLRSDTVTRPTPAMRAAMAAAEVGDDVYGEDPTVRRLEELAADRFGREAALLCPSGVMCNQIALRVLAEPGSEVVVEADAHVVNYEAGAHALLGGIQFRTVPGARGLLDPEDVAAAIHAPQHPVLIPTSVVSVEQTHNRGGGSCYPIDRLEAIRARCDAAGVALYMDGARAFNAAVATGADPRAYGALADALMFCLSKGLGAPVGSLVVGDTALVEEARVWRRRYGGAMRQAGVFAAAGIVALEQMVDRLAEDHANARLLADAAADAYPAGAGADVETNIVYVEQVDAAAVVAGLAEHGVRAGAMDRATVRLVTHPDVSEADCRHAAVAIRKVLAATGAP